MVKQLILLLLLLPYFAIAASFLPVEFIDGNLAAAKERAAREGKLYFVQFTASWCMPCQWMEEHTFTDAALGDYVTKHYLAVKLDFDSKEAGIYKDLYKVTSLPSILIFNAKGNLIDRHEATLDATELLKILYDNNQAGNTVQGNNAQATAAVQTNPAVKISYNQGQISRPALIPDATEETSNHIYNPSTNTTAIKYQPTIAAKPTEEPEISAPRSSGNYAIQIGVYSDIYNAEFSQARAKKRFAQSVRITELMQNGKILYRVMLGAFETRESAEKYLLYLENEGVRGFVKNIDN